MLNSFYFFQLRDYCSMKKFLEIASLLNIVDCVSELNILPRHVLIFAVTITSTRSLSTVIHQRPAILCKKKKSTHWSTLSLANASHVR